MVIGEKIGAKTAEKYSFVFTFSYPEVRVVFDGNFRMHRFLQKCQAKFNDVDVLFYFEIFI